MKPKESLVTVFVLMIVLFIGGQIANAATGPEMTAYVDQSSDWCDSYGGELFNSRTIGKHGGLHCELPNNTTVHMREVAGEDFTHDWTRIEKEAIAPYDNPWYLAGPMRLMVGVAAVGISVVSLAAGLRHFIDEDNE